MNIAVVGCGQFADAHIAEAQKISGVRVIAVCDLSLRMAEQAALRFGIGGVYTDLAQMLSEVRPDVVHVTTPAASHFAVGKRVLEAGSHTYIEKPLTVNLGEAQDLMETARARGRLVCVGHNYLFDPAFRRLQQSYAGGELGEIVHVDAFMGYDLDGPFGTLSMRDAGHWVHRLPGGIPQNNLSHPLSLCLYFLREELPAVQVHGRRLRKQRYGDIRDRFFDEIRVMLRGREATAQIVFSCSARPVQSYLSVVGTRAQAIVNFEAGSLRFVRGASLPGALRKVQWSWHELQEAVREQRLVLGKLLRSRLHYFAGMRALFEAFYRAVEGCGAVPVSPRDACRVAAVMDEILSSLHWKEAMACQRE